MNESIKDERLHYDLEKINTKLTKETTRLKLLRSFFTQTSLFCEQLANDLIEARMNYKDEDTESDLQNIIKEILSFENEVTRSAKTISQNLIEPLDIFLEHYEYYSKEFIQEANRTYKEIEEEKIKPQKKLNNYNTTINSLDKLQETLLNTTEITKQEGIKSKIIETKKIADQSYQAYTQIVTEVNLFIKEREDTFGSIMEAIEQLEESRITFSKALIEKHLRITNSIANLYAKSSSVISSIISKADTKIDFKKFFCKSLGNETIFKLLERIPCKEYQDINTEEQSTISELEESKAIVKEYFINLQNGKQITEQANIISEQLKEGKIRYEFVQLLEQLATGPLVVDLVSYETLLRFCTDLLNEFDRCKDENYVILESVLMSSRRIFTTNTHKKEFLYLELIKHGIWKDIEIWQKFIDYNIAIKLNRIKNIKPKRKFSKLFSKMKTALGFKSSKITPKTNTEEDECTTCKYVNNTLSQFTYYLYSCYIDLNSVLKLYEEYGKKFGIPEDRMKDLELDLRSYQDFPKVYEKKEDLYYKRFVSRCKKYGKKKPFIFSLAIKFIGDKNTLRNLLLLNKAMYDKLKVPVFKQILVRLNLKVTVKQRLNIWSQILSIVIFFNKP